VQNQETAGSNCGVKDRDKVRQEGDWMITPKNRYEKRVQYMVIEK
jgi:hypothetical protein